MKAKTIAGVCLVALVLALASCYSMDVHVVRSDEIGITKDDKILVYVDSPNLEFQDALATSIKDEFVKYGRQAVCFNDLFSPLKTYSPEEISEILNINRIDATLTVNVSFGNEYSGSVLLYGTAWPVYNNQLFMQVELNDIQTGQPILKVTITGESEDLSIESLLKKTPERIVRTIYPEIEEEIKAEKAAKRAEAQTRLTQ